jgi:membrane protease YdiL (CAAX protease family)
VRAFAIFLALMAIALGGIALFAWPAWELLTPTFDLKFHRVASRIAMLVFLVGFVLVARRLRVADRASLGFSLPRGAFLRELGKGLVLGAVLMLPILATMIVLDMRELRAGVHPDALGWLKLAAVGLGTGLVVALIEETFLRGAMHTAIARESGHTTAIVLVSLIYAATHFFARTRIPSEEVDAGSGLDMLAGLLASFAQPAAIIDAFLTLFAVGLLLGMVRRLTGNIAACIGLHAVWVAIIYAVRETSHATDGPMAFLMSDYDGFIGWMVLAWTTVIGTALFFWYRGSPTIKGDIPN